MTLEQFVNKVENAVRAYFGSGLQITVQKIMKNNSVEMTGLIFMEKGSDIAATIYLDSYYEEYEKGTPLGEIVRQLILAYEDHRPVEKLKLDFFRDYEQVRARLACRLINLERNCELLEQTPHQVWLDLAVTPCCILMGDELGCACIQIRYEHMRRWKIDEESLIGEAMANMRQILRPEFISMAEFLYDLARSTGPVQMPETEPEKKEMFILSNTQHFYGAAALLYPEVYELLAGEKKGFFILPSSVHEVILLADTGQESRSGLYRMVSEVNAGNVPQEEFLSNSVYYFDRKEKKIRIL
ncbi:MAG TPA: hypothetical protein H9717_07685 [Candidatus Eisenbergiella merdipullorum]|uniref:DUF1444 family protein n=1 Tax=Candidatus Eisenbergiella merdipullorum TaxID=2838553 RepID=A0A9D2L040_9FIRM|nr:hypothetical protein [Candidatus Eisenbergiella merdipullorum]